MNLQYIGLDEINGPLIFLDDVEGVGFEEMVEIKLANQSSRYGRVVQIEGKKKLPFKFLKVRKIFL